MDYAAAVSWLLGLTNYESVRMAGPSPSTAAVAGAPSVGHTPSASAPIAAANWDLRRVEELFHRLGDPHLGPATLHVAGTKGKGSTCALLASALTSSGYKTGLYTSPHLHTIRERISINGYLVSEEEFAEAASQVRPALEEVNAAGTYGRLTTFEALTAMAFLVFQRHEADVQVVEVGLGGRLDATNLVQPAVTGITSLSMDHEAFLGHTLREIAGEKAGIIKPGTPVVCAPQDPEALEIIEARCAELNAPLTLLGRDVYWRRENQTVDGQDFTVWGTVAGRPIEHSLRTALLGEHQLENAALAMAMLEHLRDLHYPVPHDTIYWGFANVHWPGRLEVVRERPLVILDGAHNRYSAMRLAEAIKQDFPRKRLVLVLGTSADKDVEGIAQELAVVAQGAIATRSKHARAASVDAVADALWQAGAPVRPEPAVSQAVERAIAEAGPDGMVLVTGSLFIVAEAREHLLGLQSETYV
jgi:dihydrofolate synthase/folylpolyglutamate synthase